MLAYITRLGKQVKSDKVFESWTSNNLPQMLNAVSLKTNLIDRHFLLQSIIIDTYPERANHQYRDMCIKYSQMHIKEFNEIISALGKQMDGELPRVVTFQHYATILTENADFDRAIEVCKAAIKYNLNDGTKSGYAGRIARIEKKAKNAKNLQGK
ncbi:MAG: hypothetical protein V7690_06690 [Shewanella sp.]|uniref:hypothetical protein n=1 Tax=Shewanella sp. TaxID=50422 RepID=UPI0030034406